jgi:hypothetical protein
MSRYAVVFVALFFVLAAPALGAGGPAVGASAGPGGVTARGVADRYVTRSVPRGTLVLQVQRHGGEVVGSRFLRDRLVVPVVAFDGSATGLSADGRTLVLAGSGHFAVLDTETLRVHQTVRLPGSFTLDAVSRDGTQLYLIQTLSARESRYEVRRYDLAQRRLLPRPVIDPAEPDEPMNGVPISRAMSRDGRWAYTLYDGGGAQDGTAVHPFLHALDTSRGRAKCVDLDPLEGRSGLIDLRLGLGGDGAVVVRSPTGRTVLTVDPRTFAVHTPRRAAAPPARSTSTDSTAAAIGVVALLLLSFAAVKLGATARRTNLGH